MNKKYSVYTIGLLKMNKKDDQNHRIVHFKWKVELTYRRHENKMKWTKYKYK